MKPGPVGFGLLLAKIMNRIVLVLIALLTVGQLFAQEESDDRPKDDVGKSARKPFAKLVSPDYEVAQGLFTIYRKENKVYFAIADSLMGRKMLIASRIAAVSDATKKAYAGELRNNPLMFYFTNDGKNIYMNYEQSSYTVDPNSAYKKAFDRNFIPSVIETFPVVSTNPEGMPVIDVSSFFAKEIPIVTPFASKGKPGSLDKEASELRSVSAFENNVELRSFFNFSTNSYPYATIVNRSIVLLPREPMTPRLWDRRMNYFNVSETVFDENSNEARKLHYVTRFRVEPRADDVDNYLAGKLVEPAKQIHIYVDNGVPEKFRPYVIDGLETWNDAFEKIGFKNVIKVEMYPDDPDFNPDDINNVCFRVVTSNVSNAMGKRFVDPRSGEIITGDIIWYANVLEVLHEWRLIQTGPADPEARKRSYSTEMMGDMIRYAVAHELGHTLGFQHNMRASYAYPVDSLFSASFTKQYGTTPSIMDYARFNYMAQPGDTDLMLTPPRLGVFDYFAIEYGYKYFPNIPNAETEYPALNALLLSKADDEMYRFVSQPAMGVSPDPAAQAESVGDDCIRASEYGIKNLHYVMDNLLAWCVSPEDQEYDYLRKIYEGVGKQWKTYLGHVMSYIGGVYQYYGVEGEDVPLQTPIEKEKQRQSVQFILNEIANSDWLMSDAIDARLGSQKNEWVKLNLEVLDQMMSGYFFQRLETYRETYTSDEYLNDIADAVWSLSDRPGGMTDMDMVLQQSYVHNLINMVYGSKNHLKAAPADELYYCGDWLDDEQLASGNAAKVNYVDHFVIMAAMTQLNRAEKETKKHRSGENREHFELLRQLVQGNSTAVK